MLLLLPTIHSPSAPGLLNSPTCFDSPTPPGRGGISPVVSTPPTTRSAAAISSGQRSAVIGQTEAGVGTDRRAVRSESGRGAPGGRALPKKSDYDWARKHFRHAHGYDVHPKASLLAAVDKFRRQWGLLAATPGSLVSQHLAITAIVHRVLGPAFEVGTLDKTIRTKRGQRVLKLRVPSPVFSFDARPKLPALLAELKPFGISDVRFA